MTDTTNQPVNGYGKLGAAIVASWAASYAMTQFSLHGVDFTEFGVNSEIVKSTIVGALVGLFTWASPSHLVGAVSNVILFVKGAMKQWRDALKNPN